MTDKRTPTRVEETVKDEKFDSSTLDRRSYNLGVIFAFAEVVAFGCKRLALSPALTKAQFEDIRDEVQLIADEFNLVLNVDDDFLTTKLFNPSYTTGKTVIHLAAEQATIDGYKELKEYKNKHAEAGLLNNEIEIEIARRLGHLLSYSDEAIDRLLENPQF